MLDVGRISYSSGKRSVLLWIPAARVWAFPWEARISASPTHLDAIFLPFAVEALFIQFSFPF